MRAPVAATTTRHFVYQYVEVIFMKRIHFNDNSPLLAHPSNARYANGTNALSDCSVAVSSHAAPRLAGRIARQETASPALARHNAHDAAAFAAAPAAAPSAVFLECRNAGVFPSRTPTTDAHVSPIPTATIPAKGPNRATASCRAAPDPRVSHSGAATATSRETWLATTVAPPASL